MFNLVSIFFVLAGLFCTIPQQSFCMADYEPIQEDIKTFTQWSNRCFKELFERKIQSFVLTSPIQQGELLHILRCFLESWKPLFEDHGLWRGDLFVEKERQALFGVPSLTPLKGDSLDYFEAYYPFVQKKVIPDDSQVCFIGDLHGSVHSLLRNLWRLVALGWLGDDFKLTQKNRFIVFNGDFVDRGAYGVECIYTLLRLKLANWDNVFLLRGNHESMYCMSVYGFLDEVKTKYKIDDDPVDVKKYPLLMLLQRFNELLPFALYLGSGKDAANGDKPNFVQCCHGGIETGYDPKPLLDSAGDMMFEKIPKDIAAGYKCCKDEIEKNNNYAGFNWSDFQQRDDLALIFNGSRGAGYLTGPQGAKAFLAGKNLKAFFRGHQDRSFGFKMLFESLAALNLKKSSLKGSFSVGDYKDGPYWWKYVVGEKIDNFKTNDFSPIFTFTSAAEGQGVPYDCFGILTVAQNYENWVLTPHEHPLSGHFQGDFNRKGKSFTRIDLDAAMKGCLVHFFEDKEKGNAGVQGLLAQKACDNIAFKKPAPHVQSVLVKSLRTLQTSLTLLKTKLTSLKDTIQKLKRAL